MESKSKEEKELKKIGEIEQDDEYDYITVPPDGGYGWVVLIACFLINLIIDGFLYAFGAFSEDLQRAYNCKEWAVTLIISLACGFYLLSAPLASALCNKFGCRPVGIIGSILASTAIGASILSPNIYVMWLLFGFIGGISMGLVYLPSLVMVGYYFEEKRAIATGIVTAGTGIGSITFGPLSRFLFDRLDWKIGLLILTGIILCCAFCCALMRPLTPTRKQRRVDDTSTKDVANKTETVVQTTSSGVQEVAKRRGRHDSTRSRQSITAEDATRPLYKEDVLYQGDTKELPEYQDQPDIPTYIQETTKVPELPEKTPMKSFWDTFLSMTNIELLKEKEIMLICLANVCSMIGYYIPYLFIVNMATLELSIPKVTAVFLLSIIGFSNTAVRFASGWITKLPYMSPLLVNNIGLTVAGISTFLVPLCRTHLLLIIYCIVWGAFIAFHISLSPVIVCQLVGLEKYSSALGLTLMFRGITSLAAPPIMGAIRDATNSYNIPFIIAGISFLISALMHFVLMWLISKKNQYKTVNKADANPKPVAV